MPGANAPPPVRQLLFWDCKKAASSWKAFRRQTVGAPYPPVKSLDTPGTSFRRPLQHCCKSLQRCTFTLNSGPTAGGGEPVNGSDRPTRPAAGPEPRWRRQGTPRFHGNQQAVASERHLLVGRCGPSPGPALASVIAYAAARLGTLPEPQQVGALLLPRRPSLRAPTRRDSQATAHLAPSRPHWGYTTPLCTA